MMAPAAKINDNVLFMLLFPDLVFLQLVPQHPLADAEGPGRPALDAVGLKQGPLDLTDLKLLYSLGKREGFSHNVLFQFFLQEDGEIGQGEEFALAEDGRSGMALRPDWERREPVQAPATEVPVAR